MSNLEGCNSERKSRPLRNSDKDKLTACLFLYMIKVKNQTPLSFII